MSGIESWLFGYTGGKLADAILSLFKEDAFIGELRTAVKKWADNLPQNARLSATDALFNRNTAPEEKRALQIIRAQFDSAQIPSLNQWHEALMEQWHFVRKSIKDPQDFFKIPEEEASNHLNNLSKALVIVCEQNDRLFKGTTIKILMQIHQAITDNPNMKEKNDNIKQLSDDEKKLLRRLYDYDGYCAVKAPKGEYKCLWVPGDGIEMQWGYERTPQETILSGKEAGDRKTRMKWLYIVIDLVEKGLIMPVEGENSLFELTEKGRRVAHDIS